MSPSLAHLLSACDHPACAALQPCRDHLPPPAAAAAAGYQGEARHWGSSSPAGPLLAPCSGQQPGGGRQCRRRATWTGAPRASACSLACQLALPVCSLSQKVFSQRSDRVKSVELHPTEPWCVAGAATRTTFMLRASTAVAACSPCPGEPFLPAGSWRLCIMATSTSGIMRSRCCCGAALGGSSEQSEAAGSSMLASLRGPLSGSAGFGL